MSIRLGFTTKSMYTIYKFRVPECLTEQQFLKCKSTEKKKYLKKVKGRLKKEKLVFLRHHWLSLITFWISIILLLSTILLIFISLFLKYDSILEANQFITIIFICLVISIIALIVLQIRGFPGSFLSFRRYIKEKYNSYCELKDIIDGCKDFHNYKERHFKYRFNYYKRETL